MYPFDTFNGVVSGPTGSTLKGNYQANYRGRQVTMRSRSESLEFALLGLLSQSPLHGYELRKRMGAIFGPFRALSFSVLYPQLRRMMEAGLIAESTVETFEVHV